ncbi:MAG: PadR family transcriptional regulator [Longimicrobiales bacterium]
MTTPTHSLPAACFHVLLSLSDSSRHGLGIMEEVEARTDGVVLLGPGSLYGSLKRLVNEGFIVESNDRPVEDDDARRRYYEITGPGRSALRAELETLAKILDTAREKALIPGGSR